MARTWSAGWTRLQDATFGFRVLGVDTSNHIQQFRSTDGSSWTTGDISNGGLAIGTPAVMHNSGRLDVMAVGLDGQVWLETSAAGVPGADGPGRRQLRTVGLRMRRGSPDESPRRGALSVGSTATP